MDEGENAGSDALDGEIVDAAPAWLNDGGRAVWQTLYPTLRRTNFIKSQDFLALARYCDHFARWLKLREKVDAQGETYETESKHGKLQRINPDLNAMLRIEGSMLALEDRFGLAPATRLKILKDLAAANGSLPFDDLPEQRKPAAAQQQRTASPIGLLRVVPNKH